MKEVGIRKSKPNMQKGHVSSEVKSVWMEKRTGPDDQETIVAWQ